MSGVRARRGPDDIASMAEWIGIVDEWETKRNMKHCGSEKPRKYCRSQRHIVESDTH
jgi:hypothetical protein